MLHFSRRTSWQLGESAYAAAVRAARAHGHPVLDLTISNSTSCGFEYPPEILTALADLRGLTYDPDPRGMQSAREAVTRYYADHRALVAPAAVLLAASTSESYSFLFRLLCDPEDEVLVARPGYPLFDFLAAIEDVKLREYPLFYDHGWWIDVAQLERSITPRTRAIVVVHPGNPTGHWTTARERKELEAVCARHHLALIVDEVFLDYPLNDDPVDNEAAPASFATGSHPVLTFVLSGLSKVAGLPQMKLAWLLTFGPEPDTLEALARLEMIADTFLSVSTPVQLAAPASLAGRRLIQQQIMERTRANWNTLLNLARDNADRLQVFNTDAGWSALIALPGCGGDPHCAERLVRERSLVVHPGAFYGLPGGNRVVVSLIVEPAIFEEGILAAIRDR